MWQFLATGLLAVSAVTMLPNNRADIADRWKLEVFRAGDRAAYHTYQRCSILILRGCG